jgi:hypothetical protein
MKIVKNLVVLCVSLIVALLLAELLVRLVAPQETGIARLERFPAIYQDSNVTSYEFKPGTQVNARIPDRPYAITINNEGTRGPEFGPKEPGEYRVVLLGDSMTFGQGLNDNETIAAQLEHRLAAEGTLTTVINAGVPGWGPDQEALMLMRNVSSWQPDIVFWMIFLGNDIDDLGRHYVTYDNGTLVSAHDPAKYVVDGRAIHNVSRTVGGWWKYVQPLQQPLDDHSQLYALAKNVLFTPFVVGPDDLTIYTLDGKYQSWQEQAEGIVGAAAKQSSVPVVLVLLPHRVQFTAVNVTGDMNASRKEWREYANSQLLPLLDAYAVLSDCGTTCYFALDGHLNYDGDAKVAALLDAYIRQG